MGNGFTSVTKSLRASLCCGAPIEAGVGFNLVISFFLAVFGLFHNVVLPRGYTKAGLLTIVDLVDYATPKS